MKKTFYIFLLIILPLFGVAIYAANGASSNLSIHATIPVIASCNESCAGGETCASGLTCQSGLCRNPSYPDSATCACEVNCGGGHSAICNEDCSSDSCVSWLTCSDIPLLGKRCRNAQALNATDCLLTNDVKINIRAWPEFRLPFGNPNYTLPGILEIRNLDGTLVTSTLFISGRGGWATVGVPSSTFSALPDTYDLSIKGISHLLKATSSVYLINKIVTTQDGDNQIDFTLYPTRYFENCPGICRETYNTNPINGNGALLAGDVLSPKDNYINGGDISAIAGVIYSNNQDADLNWDGAVNGGDISIWAKNIYKKGE